MIDNKYGTALILEDDASFEDETGFVAQVIACAKLLQLSLCLFAMLYYAAKLIHEPAAKQQMGHSQCW
jgi:hypothetical protein